MSIDADLRAGLIDGNQARAKREELQSESRFYGALDGAMKFVKGDSIAGLIVTGINVVGGLSLGIAVYGLGIFEALDKYTLLTIGDGLASQNSGPTKRYSCRNSCNKSKSRRWSLTCRGAT